MTKTYGYVRVSTKQQNEARQMDEMLAQGIELKNIYIDKESGKDFNRKAYQRLIYRKMKRGDVLVVKSIDRLGRNYQEILNEWKVITKEKGYYVKILDMPLLDTAKDKDLIGTVIADIVLQLLSFIAENERNTIRQRQAEGIQAAMKRGVRFGRPKLPYPEEFELIVEKWENKELSTKEAMRLTNFKYSTFYKKVALYKETKNYHNEKPTS